MKYRFFSHMWFLVSFFWVGTMFAQTPQEVLKVGTVFTLEGEDRLSGTKSQFTVRIESVGAQIDATRTDIGQDPRRVTDILRDVQLPLAIGKTWKQDYQFQRQWRGQLSNYRHDGQATVVTEETLLVADRPTRTYRIEYKGWINRIGGGQAYSWEYAHSRWYAPELGYVVRHAIVETDKGRKILDYSLMVIGVDPPPGTAPTVRPTSATAVATTINQE